MTSNTLETIQDRRDIPQPKSIHSIVLDASPILLNTPSISTLIANSETLVTTQSVLDEIRGEEARNRLETTYRPFLTIRSPKSTSIQFVREFARQTGDAGVLSATDFEILALAYDLECERNNGDWRLRSTPGQKRVNGSPPTKPEDQCHKDNQTTHADTQVSPVTEAVAALNIHDIQSSNDGNQAPLNRTTATLLNCEGELTVENSETSRQIFTSTSINSADEKILDGEVDSEEESANSDGGWITPSNIKRQKAKDDAKSDSTRVEIKAVQVATITGDFAMQNVLLQMNLNLLSTRTCKRVTHIKQMIFRCHACFATTRDMSKRFCPRCGGATLTRVTCTTNDRGEVKLHLKANHQWNNRGNVFSIPKPVSGSANQKWNGPRHGGGKGGWGTDLILAEDQKQYTRALSSAKRNRNKDLMDEDVLPGILTGERNQGNGRIRVGAGRNVNSRKR